MILQLFPFYADQAKTLVLVANYSKRLVFGELNKKENEFTSKPTSEVHSSF